MNIHEETLKIARNLIKKDPSLTDWVISKFPELKEDEESRDEMIRKSLSAYFAKFKPNDMWDNDFSFCDILAWIEKRGGQKQDIIIPKFRVGDTIRTKNSETEYTITEISNGYYRGKGWCLNIAAGDECGDYELVEQKPADKIEPKFKIGDLITNGILVGKIDEIHELGYHAYFGDHYADVPDIENWHKWTIEDAKDGDILCGYPESDYPWIGIFHKLNTEGTFNSYCFLQAGQHGKFCPPSEENIFGKRNVDNHISECIVPATKEQRNTLMKAMADAGYIFDFENKELKKVEQKPEEDEEKINFLVNLIRFQVKDSKYSFGYGDNVTYVTKEEAIDMLKSLRPQNLWESVDKDLYVSEPTLAQRKDISKNDIFKGYVLCADHTLTPDVYKRYISVRDIANQKQWKPSEEQVTCLQDAIDDYHRRGYKAETLETLLKQLKQI